MNEDIMFMDIGDVNSRNSFLGPTMVGLIQMIVLVMVMHTPALQQKLSPKKTTALLK